jgi:predicted nuclease of predicted toxin-antitoxin system
MILMDENIDDDQRDLLQKWRIPFRHIGTDEARKGIQDDEIASLLRHRRNVTFFTRDADFYKSRLCHLNCCIVLLNIPATQVAEYVRKFLRHSIFQTQTQRMGTVVRVSHDAIHLWRLHAETEETVNW